MNIGLQITKNIEKYNHLISFLDLKELKNISLIHITDEKSLQKHFKDLDILVCYQMTPELFSYRSDRLKWIHIGASGVDGNLFNDLIKSRVMVTNSKGINSKPVAEFTMAQILYFSKKIKECEKFKEERIWNQWELAKTTTQLSESTLGIIGYGEIGKELSKLAKSFGMKVIATRRLQKKVENKKYVDELLPLTEINRIYKESDFLSIACPLTPNTENLIDKNSFKLMKDSAFIINTSRGKIINEEDLIVSLQNNDIAGAALDVFSAEPLDKSSNLFTLDNVLLSPHISGNFSNYQEKMMRQFSEMVIKYISNKALKNRVCKKRLY